MNRKTLIIGSILATSLASASAQITLVKEGKPQTRIVLTENTEENVAAAELLQSFVERISKARIPIATGKGKEGDVIIGGKSAGATEDGFGISTRENTLRITSGGGNGAAYGVAELLEKYMGVSYWAAEAFDYEERSSIELPLIEETQSPAFRYRQTQSYGTADPVYKLWYRLEEPKEVFAANYWVHTFNRLIPSAEYGKTHPEYYAYFNGKRQPGTQSQLCLTNPDVYDLMVFKLDSIFKANPDQTLISVSQNDGNATYCTCPNCARIDKEEGAQAGSLIWFMNKLAERFPDKEISTLAYLYSMHPPKKIKPLDNVNIMLCSIDSKREVPLTDNASGRDFVKAIEGWSKISNNIFVWDYGINFDNCVSPFPNFHILKPNIKLFKDNNVTMHFSQVNGYKGADFSELRAYMIAKLMWNPDADADALMQTFLKGYYGDAAPYLYQYHKIMEGALLSSGIGLWIYDSPISHKHGMLRPALLKTYNELFDKAEAAVANNPKLLERVQLSRLTLQYSELELARTEPMDNPEDVRKKLALFEKRTAHFEVPTLNERNNKPADYCILYRERYLPNNSKPNLALGAEVEYIVEPAKGYMPIAGKALTDGLYGGTTFVESWVGWEGIDGAFVLDLGSEKVFTTLESDFLHQLGAWILQPKSVTYSTSTDNNTYKKVGTHTFAEDKTPGVKFVKGRVVAEQSIKARYVKVEIEGLKVCPDWHYGVGHPAWFFIDEVVIN